jgi:hypothetical protein
MYIRTIFSAALLLLSFSALYAQVPYQVGATLGASYSSLQSDLFYTSSGRPSVAFGGAFVVGIGQYFELNQEVVFVQKGANAKAVYFRPEATPEQRVYNYYYNSFEAALFAGYSPTKHFPLTIQVGGFMGTHFHRMDNSAREVYIQDYQNINNALLAYHLNDAFSGVDYGPAVGISAGKNRIRVNARYFHGTRNMYDNLDFVEGKHRITTQSFRLSVSYFLK